MRIETITVKVLRSSRQYANDELSFTVALDDKDDDWTTIERELRHKAVDAIERHWVEREEEERLDYEKAEAEARAKQVAARDEWLKEDWESNDAEEPCETCPFLNSACEVCEGCPHEDAEKPAPF